MGLWGKHIQQLLHLQSSGKKWVIITSLVLSSGPFRGALQAVQAESCSAAGEKASTPAGSHSLLQFTFLQAVFVNHWQCGKNTQKHEHGLSLKITSKCTVGESSEKKVVKLPPNYPVCANFPGCLTVWQAAAIPWLRESLWGLGMPSLHLYRSYSAILVMTTISNKFKVIQAVPCCSLSALEGEVQKTD